ncbi:MAG: hypothetical protein HQK49_20830 [Oligoflexia bacterium]|nr:hypothetical protein [Oligoflexia bacterium]
MKKIWVNIFLTTVIFILMFLFQMNIKDKTYLINISSIFFAFYVVQSLNLFPFNGLIKENKKTSSKIFLIYHLLLSSIGLIIFSKTIPSLLLISGGDNYLGKTIVFIGVFNLFIFSLRFFAKNDINQLIENIILINSSWILVFIGLNLNSIKLYSIIIANVGLVLFAFCLLRFHFDKRLNSNIFLIELTRRNTVSILLFLLLVINTITIPFGSFFEMRVMAKWSLYTNQSNFIKSYYFVILFLEIFLLYKFVDLFFQIFKVKVNKVKTIINIKKNNIVIMLLIFGFLIGLGIFSVCKMIFVMPESAIPFQIGHYYMFITEIIIIIATSCALIGLKLFPSLLPLALQDTGKISKFWQWLRINLQFKINNMEERNFNLEAVLIFFCKKVFVWGMFAIGILYVGANFLRDVLSSMHIYFNEE